MFNVRLMFAAFVSLIISIISAEAQNYYTTDSLEVVDFRVDHSDKAIIYCSVKNTREIEDTRRTKVVVSFKKGDKIIYVALSGDLNVHDPGQISEFVFGPGKDLNILFATDLRLNLNQVDFKLEDYDSYEIYVLSRPVSLRHEVLEFDKVNERYHDENGNYVEGDISLKEESFNVIERKVDFGSGPFYRNLVMGEVVNNTNAIIHNVRISFEFNNEKFEYANVASNYNPILGTLIYPGESVPYVIDVDTRSPIESWAAETSFRPAEIVGFDYEQIDDSGQEKEDEEITPSVVEMTSWGMIKSTF